MFTNPLIRRAEQAAAEVEAGLDPNELRWFFHLRMAGGTVALASVLLLVTIWVVAPIRAAATGVERPLGSSARYAYLGVFPGWPNFSLPWGVPAAFALASVVLTVLTFCVGSRLREGMVVPLLTSLVVTAVFVAWTTGILYWGSSRWERWQAVFALVPLAAALVVQVTHLIDARRPEPVGRPGSRP